MKKMSAIIGGSTVTIVGLFLLTTVVAVPSVSAYNDNCVDIQCLKEKLRLICETDPKQEYLDCPRILRCMDADEQKAIRCGTKYLLPTQNFRIVPNYMDPNFTITQNNSFDPWFDRAESANSSSSFTICQRDNGTVERAPYTDCDITDTIRCINSPEWEELRCAEPKLNDTNGDDIKEWFRQERERCMHVPAPPECARTILTNTLNENENETESEVIENLTRECNSLDLLYRSWCEYTRGTIPK